MRWRLVAATMAVSRAGRAAALIGTAAVVVAATAISELRPRAATPPAPEPCQASFASLQHWAVMDCRPPGSDWTLAVTDDGGRRWYPFGVTFTQTPTLFWFGDRDAILVGTASGVTRIWLSDDGGRSWKGGAALPRAAGPATPAFADQRHGLLLAGAGLWRTADAGRSWQRLHPRGLPAGGTRQLLALLSPQVGLLAVEQGDHWPQILETADGGRSWRPAGPPPPPGEVPLGAEMGLLRGSGWLVLWMVAELRDTTATGGVVPRLETSLSRNGAAWSQWAVAPGVEGATPLADPSGGLWLTDSGVLWHSPDGGRTWSERPLPAGAGDDVRLVFVGDGQLVATAFPQEGTATAQELVVSRGGAWRQLPEPSLGS
jgi:photosystem II stability/assembly factor-like uncharacterized protein